MFKFHEHPPKKAQNQRYDSWTKTTAATLLQRGAWECHWRRLQQRWFVESHSLSGANVDHTTGKNERLERQKKEVDGMEDDWTRISIWVKF